ncbi:peptidoglycan DD-metalloendopeptidase family protein [Streptomyces sp. NPDC006285]|uniref:peptidoglycan DD-metalloendopeptidase family protein n=1 Tax=Streptomyces sp. NPDC006285 TaxID=3364742 RepID=UPI0036AB04D1
MAGELDIVGSVAVDVVPVAPTLHTRLKTIVLPIADRVGEDAGRRFGDAMSRHITVSIPQAINAGGNAARTVATRQGNDNAGLFGRAFKARLEAAFKSLPKPNVRISDVGWNADLARLRASMETLSNKVVGVDIDAATAMAELERLDGQLERLGARNPDIDVRVNIGAARAELAAMQRAVNDLDRDDVNIQVRANTAPAMAALLQLGIALGAVAAIPVIPVAAAGIGAIASAALAAGAGVGVLALAAVPAIKSVTSVIQAKSAADKEAAQATEDGGAATVRAAQRAQQMVSAQAALSSAHRNAARSIAQANRGVEDAERAVAQAAQRASDQRRAAAEAVQRAERSLVDAKRSARQAEQDLTQARADAAQQLRDLNDQLREGALDQRDAALRTREAEEELNRVRAQYDAGQATQLQLERAQLAYDQASEGAKQSAKDYAELQKSAADATKAGVDGNADVVRTTEQVATAQRAVKDQASGLADARRNAARTEVEAAQSVADAERRVSDAKASAADAQVKAAESIATAERGVESARLSGIDTTSRSASKADEYREALEKLSPAQRDLYDSIMGPSGIKNAFSAWQRELQPDVLPLFTRMVNGAKRALPGLTPLAKNSAGAVGELQDAASRQTKSPFWVQFKRGITGAARPAIVGLGKSFGNTFKGMAGVLAAFFPKMDSISERMQKITGRFADWGTGLGGSPAFENFLDYASEMAPVVAEAIGDILSAVFQIGKALSPISGPLLKFFGGIADGIATIAEKAPWLIQAVYGIIIAVKLWAIAQWALNAAMQANPIGLVIIAVVALVAAVVLAWNKFPWFRDAVMAAWKGIQDATSFLWDNYLKPFFTWMGDIFVWLWTKIIKPYIGFMISYWKMVGSVISWLWTSIFSPVFGFIGDLIAWWWKNIVKRYSSLVMDIIRTVGGVFRWLYDKSVKPVFDWIGDKADWLWRKGIKPAFDKIKSAVRLVSDAFGTAKNGIKKHWYEVASIAARPVNFVIEYAYTKGIKAVFDRVTKYAGMDPLPKAPKLLPEKFADGGRTRGGIPGKDSIPALMMADEYVVKRDSARKVGFGTLEYINRYGALPGVQKFADGGIVGALGGAIDWTKDIVGKGVDWAKKGADLVANPSKVWTALTKPILAKVAQGVGDSPMGKTLATYPKAMVSGLKDKITESVSSMFGGGGGGQWLKPVNAPYGTRFGVPGLMWSSGRHTGLDFPAAVGAAVRAVADGRVSQAASGGPYGNHIMVNHGGGLQSLYAHLSKMSASVSESVKAGERIGSVGATGNVTGPHLHLEARLNGKSVDPMGYLTGGGGGGKGVQRWRGVVQQALNMTGNSLSNTDLTLRRMNQESGGDPLAVNRWDSNWDAGHPSVGLMQVIGPTFRRYAGKMKGTGPFSYGVSTNPLANVFASMRYAKATYGSLGAAYNRPGGYANGGRPPLGQWSIVGEQGPELVNFLSPAQVHSNSDSKALLREMASMPAGGGAAPSIVINDNSKTIIDGNEVRGLVDRQIQAYDERTGMSIDVGRNI